jgi:hypothetical protein
MNSHFLAGMNCGEFALVEEITAERVRKFLGGSERFAPALAALRGRMDGTADVLRVIRHRLNHPQQMGGLFEPRVTAAAAARSPAAAPASPGPDG